MGAAETPQGRQLGLPQSPPSPSQARLPGTGEAWPGKQEKVVPASRDLEQVRCPLNLCLAVCKPGGLGYNAGTVWANEGRTAARASPLKGYLSLQSPFHPGSLAP